MKNRVVLITGGARGIGRGIGRGIAEAFLRAGARVMIADLGARAGGWAYDLTGRDALKQAAFEAAMHETIPLGRPQTVEDMGQAAVYLASARNVTGVSLSVAGGFEMA